MGFVKAKCTVLGWCTVVIFLFCFSQVVLAEEQQSSQQLEAGNASLIVKNSAGSLKLHGYLQSYYAWFEQDTKHSGFETNRARIILDGKVLKDIAFRIQIDAAASTDILRCAYIKYTCLPYADLKLGQFKIPFSEEQLTSSAKLDVFKRAQVASKLSYSYDIGMMLERKLLGNKLYYGIGVFNGSGRNTADNNENKDLIGRVVISPFKGSENIFAGLSLGCATQIGKQPSSGTSTGDRNRYGALFKYTYANLKLQGEYILQQQEQIDQSRKDSDGWYALLTYSFVPALAGALKYEQYDPDRALAGDRGDIGTLGLNWFLNNYTKLQFNYRFKKQEESTDLNREFFLQAQIKY